MIECEGGLIFFKKFKIQVDNIIYIYISISLKYIYLQFDEVISMRILAFEGAIVQTYFM